MIEFLLLFALGFLAATLLALIIAPVIHRRIITLTERRIRASVPLSAAEIRAEKDSARAAYAVENARLAVELRDQRDHLATETGNVARLKESLARAHEEALALKQAMAAAEEEAGALRSHIRDQETAIDTLRAELHAAERATAARNHEIERHEARIAELSRDIEELRIDLATRDTETENFRAQLQALRDERAVMRDQLRAQKMNSRETEIRLKREGGRVAELDERLNKTISTLSQREELLERRAGDIARLQERQKEMAAQAREAARAIRSVKTGAPAKANGAPPSVAAPVPPAEKATALPSPNAVPSARASALTSAARRDVDRDEADLVEHLKARQAAIAERLVKARDTTADAALRKEIAEIAALMIELAAVREGSGSPIFRTLAGAETIRSAVPGEPSLAERANRLLR